MEGNQRVGASVGLLLLGFALLLFAAGRSSAGLGPPAWCEPPEALRSQLEALEPWGSECFPGQPCWQSRVDAAKKLVATYPDDLFVNHTYQDLLRIVGREGPGAAGLAEEYKARARKHPADAVAQYLAGRVSENTDDERKLYEKALAIALDFPWAHRGLVVVEARKPDRASRDQALMRREAERFMTLCPAQVGAALQLANLIEDAPFWQDHVAGLRAAVQAARPHQQMQAYPLLWSLEFRLASVAQHPPLRTQVASDLKAIEDLHLVDDLGWWAARAKGLELMGNVEGKKRLAAELAQRHPCSQQGVEAAFEKWGADHQYPAENAGEGEKASFAKVFYDATTEWLLRCPDEFQFWLVRLAAIGLRKELPNGAVKTDLDRILDLWERYKGLVKMWESPYVQAARLFLDRGIEIERVPSLVEKEIELRRESREERKSWPEEKERQQMMVGDSIQLARLQVLAGRAELALGRKNAAHKALADASAALDAVRADATEIPRVVMALHDAEAELWEQRAGLAAAEGHTLDASAMLLKASSLAPKRAELAERAKTLWRQAGGSVEGWALLTATLAESRPAGLVVATEQSGWEKGATALKPFDLQALDGKRWTLEDLKGKVAFVNVWATWCGPCREELPEVQKLCERLRDRKDVVLLTLNVDTDVGLVAPFLANKKYSFPALLADAYIRDLWKDSLSIPRNWIFDRAGVVRYEQTGFDSRARDKWADGVMKLIDGLTQEKAPADGSAHGKESGVSRGP
jgi:thiol-disulfide isomerase/thioredoxin